MDQYLIDHHKIMYHPEWEARFKKDPFSVLPVYLEISPVGYCNHRCSFCAPEILGYPRRQLPFDLLKRMLWELKVLRDREPDGLGVKAIMYAGEGEPTLHPRFADICLETKAAGIDFAVTTNATGLTEKTAEKIIPAASWIKASIDAGTAESYAAIHGAGAKHWDMVWKNLKKAAEIKRKTGSSCVLGAQMVLLPGSAHGNDGRLIPSNFGGAVLLAEKAKKAGLDYLAVKPYSQHHFSAETKNRYSDIDYRQNAAEIEKLSEQLARFNDERFSVIFRHNAIDSGGRENKDRGYAACQATPTAWAYIQSDGAVISCSAYWTDDRFLLGNIHHRTFAGIWWGETRRCHLEFVMNCLDISECRKSCRMHFVNQHLWRLKNPPPHANFI